MARRPTSVRNSKYITTLADSKVVLPRLHELGLLSPVMPNQEEKVANPLSPMPVKIQRMESLATSSKPSRLRGKRLRVSTPLMGKRVRASEPSPSRERDRGRNLEPNLRKTALRLGRARVRRPRPNLPSLGRNRLQAWITKRKLLVRQAYTPMEIEKPYRTLSTL